MRCLITNCMHMSRQTISRSPSWNEMQICRCCAYNLHYLNPDEPLFLNYKRRPAIPCRSPHGRKNNHKESYDFKQGLEITLKNKPNQTMLELNLSISKILKQLPYDKHSMYWRLLEQRHKKFILKSFDNTYKLVIEELKIIV